MITFETYRDEAGEFRWRIRHENGNILADSGEGYSTQVDRDTAIETIVSGIAHNTYEVKEVDA